MAPNSGNSGHVPNAVVIFDGDDSMRNVLVNYVNGLGAKSVAAFPSADAGWQHLAENGADLIILDWKLRGLSGIALISRIRAEVRLASVPVLIVSGGLNGDDSRLLNELPYTYFMAKPVQKPVFEKRLADIGGERAWYEKHKERIDAVFNLCGSDGDLALSATMKLLGEAKNPTTLAVLYGKRMHEAGFLDTATLVLKRALQFDKNCTAAMNELAKVARAQGRYREALDLLSQAHKLVPKNLERICLLGETELNLNNPDKATAHFQAALAIDPKNDRAKAGMTIVQNIEAYMAAPGRNDSQSSMASLLNNVGVVMVRKGDFDAGLKHYLITLGLLHDKETKSRVAFNMGVGFLRWQKDEDAARWFQKSLEFDGKMASRIQGFAARLAAKGFKLNLGPQSAAAPRPAAGANDFTAVDINFDFEELMPEGGGGKSGADDDDELMEESLGRKAR